MAQVPEGKLDQGLMRRAREELGLTQAGLAEKLEVDKDSVFDWESGKARPNVENLKKLATALGLRIEDLYAGPGRRVFLKELRVKKGLKQDELAKRLNARLGARKESKITQAKVSNWELGKTLPPETYGEEYATVLGVTPEVLRRAVNETWRASHEPEGWSPLIDKRESSFKGVAAGDAELEFVYKMATNAHNIVAILMVSMLTREEFPQHAENIDPAEVRLRDWMWWQAYSLISDIRKRTVTILEAARGRNSDIVSRARETLHTLDQYLTVTEDVLKIKKRPKIPILFEDLYAHYRIEGNVSLENLFREAFGKKWLQETMPESE